MNPFWLYNTFQMGWNHQLVIGSYRDSTRLPLAHGEVCFLHRYMSTKTSVPKHAGSGSRFAWLFACWNSLYLKFDLIPRPRLSSPTGKTPHTNASWNRQKMSAVSLRFLVSPGWQYKTRDHLFLIGTVDGSEIPNSQPPGMVLKPCKLMGISTTAVPNLNWWVDPGFLGCHQQDVLVGNPSSEWSPLWHHLTCGGDRSGIEFVELPREMLTPGAQGGLDGLGVGVFF